MLLQLTDGATTVTLSGDGATMAGCSYVPATPRLTDPADIVGNRDVTMAESAEVVLTGTAAQIVAQVRAIEALLGSALRRQSHPASQRVYVNYRAENSGAVYRSEVVAGRVEFPADALTPRLASGAVAVLVLWERRYFWELTVLEPLALKRTGIAKTTSGVTVYNHHDSTSHENFVDIEGADIVGSLPAPLKVWLEATAALSTRRFYLTGNVFHAPTTWQAIYEGEASSGGGTVTADSGSSDGYYMARSWSGGIDHTANAFVWSISASQLSYAKGGWFQALLRLASTPPTDCYVRLRVMFPDDTPLTVLWQGPEFRLDSNRQLQDLGSVQLPPGYVTGNPTALALVLSIRHGGTDQLNVDYLQLDGPDGLHRFDQQGYQLEVGDLVVDDGPNQGVYIQTYGGYTQHIFSDYPPPLLVWPGRDMRIRLLFDETSGSSVIDRTFTVYAQYRPRRLTV